MRVLALDVGERRTGVAISDPDQILASPLLALERKGNDLADCEAVLEVARQQEAGLIVVGLPRLLSGELGDQARRVKGFARRLRAASHIPVELCDERLTSVEADRVLRETGAKGSRERGRRDAVAAAILLQSYLDSRRQPRE